jgi:exodeoxyribonuclease V alpha subunit
MSNTPLHLSAIDRFFLQEFLPIDIPSSLQILLLYLFQAFKEGHLCVKIEKNTLFPQIDTLWEKEKMPFEEEKLTNLIVEGYTLLPSFLTQIPSLQKMLVYAPPLLYFKRSKVVEENFLQELGRLCHEAPPLQNLTYALAQTKEQFSLNEEQEKAIISAIHSPVTLLAGGPGTGKTYTAGALLHLFATHHSPLSSLKAAALAPTGKAAKHLADTLQKAVSLCPNLHLEGFTLHKALYSLHKEEKLPFDLVLVDECSMIDASLFFRLLQGVKEGTKLILLGDPNQLPSVESGSFFADLILLVQQGFPHINSHLLQKIVRTENQEIIALAQACLVEDLQTLGASSAITLFSASEERIRLLELVEEAKEKYSFLCTDTFTEELFSGLSRFVLLSATKKSLMGTESLNRLLELALIESCQNYFVPIIATENDPVTGLCNGEVLLLQIKEKTPLQAFGLTSSGIESYPLALLPSYERAFCLSVHKAQGSEYEEIVALFPEHAERFGKELLYTAITRAKKKARIIAHKEAFFCSLQKTTRRASGLSSYRTLS